MECIIHIGAGQAEQLDQYLATGAQSIVLVEPLDEYADLLRNQTSEEPRVKVVESAVHPQGAQVPLKIFNLTELSSLFEPTGIKQLYPGLKLEATKAVHCLSPTQLLDEFIDSTTEDNWLIIDAPGAEAGIIEALITENRLKAFQKVSVVCPAMPYYSGDSQVSNIRYSLEAYGYQLTELGSNDADWPILQGTLSPLKHQLDEKARQYADAKAQSEALNQQLAAMNQDLADLAEVKAELEKAHQQALKAAKAKQTELEEALKTKEQAINAADNEAKQAEQAHQKSLEAAKTRQSELEQTLEAKSKALKAAEAATEQKTQTLKEAQDLLAQQEATIEGLQAEKQGSIEATNTLKKELEEHKGRLGSSEQQLQQTEERLKAEQQAHEKTKEALQNNQTWFANRKKEAESLKEQLAQAQQTLEQLQNQNTQLTQKLTENGSLEQKLEQLISQQSSRLTDATNALGRHITQGFVQQQSQLQAYWGVQHYLEQGEAPLNFGGWAIEADLATQLVSTLQQNNFDLIIEFGSGTSTLLLAKTLLQQWVEPKTTSEHAQLEHPTRNAKGTEKTLAHQDLPQRIISFEQDKQHFQTTQQQLEQAQLSALVDLVLAPLVPTSRANGLQSQNSTEPLFYDCEARLARLAQLYEGRQANILVLVDGPYSPQGDTLARAPALGTVLQYLSAHRLHIVLDDTKRPGEQAVANYWQSQCEQRGLSISAIPWPTEKGALYTRINQN